MFASEFELGSTLVGLLFCGRLIDLYLPAAIC